MEIKITSAIAIVPITAPNNELNNITTLYSNKILYLCYNEVMFGLLIIE